MTSPSSPSLARFAGLAAATVMVVCAAGAWPTKNLDPEHGFVGMGLAAGLAWLGAVLGYLPLQAKAAAKSVEARAQAWMIGLGLRLFVTLGVLLGLWTADVAWRASLFVWTAILYLVLLLIETVVVARSLRSFDAPRASA